MTRKHRRRPPPTSPAFSISSSAAVNTKPRRSAAAAIPPHNMSKAADYDGAGDFSDASSAYDESHQDTEEESEPFENEDDDVSDSPSSQKPTNHIPQINQIPSISYVKIAPLPIFHGFSTESPITHISRFTKVCRANIIPSSSFSSSIDDVMLRRIFPATLDGEALLWYDLNIEPYSNLSWEEIKASFLQAYHRMELEGDLKSELMRINQGDNETVRSYFLRFQWILQKWQSNHGLREELLKGVFVDGLRQEFHEWILVQKPCSLNEALRLAFGYEEMRSIRSMKKNEEKQRNDDDDEKKKGIFERSVSMEEGENVGGDDEKKKKKNECRCMKHQCSIKRMMRNASIVSTTSSYPL